MIPSNYSQISLFGMEMNPPRGFEIGALDIRLYGIMIALGLILAVVYGLRRKEQFGLKEDDILDGVLIIVPISIICARIYYCIFEWQQYAQNPIKVFYIWEGGIAIYGAVIGALASAAIYCRVRKMSIPATLDITVLGFMIGQSIGRWGNFFNREAVGALTDPNWFLRMGLFNEVTGQWEKKPYYTIEEKLPYGHGEKSVYIVSGFMRLTRAEAMAIRWHMGFSGTEDARTVGQALSQYPLAFALATADMEATYFLEKEEK